MGGWREAAVEVDAESTVLLEHSQSTNDTTCFSLLYGWASTGLSNPSPFDFCIEDSLKAEVAFNCKTAKFTCIYFPVVCVPVLKNVSRVGSLSIYFELWTENAPLLGSKTSARREM